METISLKNNVDSKTFFVLGMKLKICYPNVTFAGYIGVAFI